MRIKGKTAIVTGASRGIGRAVALDLARIGAKVALVARLSEALDETVTEARRLGYDVEAFACDVSKSKEVEATYEEIRRRLGPADILVNSAGVAVWKHFGEITAAEHRAMMDVNYWGTFEWIRQCLPNMRSAKLGRIVNIAAGSGLVAFAVTSGYSASKFAVVGLSEALHRELHGSGVGISVVNPGSVKTRFWSEGNAPVQHLPPLVRFSPKLSPRAVARTVRGCIRYGFVVRTVPLFVNFLAKVNGLWFRLGDVMLWKWFIPMVLLYLIFRILT